MKLALDLATHCGWAMFDDRGHYLIGAGLAGLGCSRESCWRCRPSAKKYGPLPQALRVDLWENWAGWLQGVLWRCSGVVYEKVASKTHTGGDAAHMYGGFLAILELLARRNNVPLELTNVSTWQSAIDPVPSARAERRSTRVRKVDMPLLGAPPPPKLFGAGKPRAHRYVDNVNALTGLSLQEKEHDIAAAIGIGLAYWSRAGSPEYRFKGVHRQYTNSLAHLPDVYGGDLQ